MTFSFGLDTFFISEELDCQRRKEDFQFGK